MAEFPEESVTVTAGYKKFVYVLNPDIVAIAQ